MPYIYWDSDLILWFIHSQLYFSNLGGCVPLTDSVSSVCAWPPRIHISAHVKDPISICRKRVLRPHSRCYGNMTTLHTARFPGSFYCFRSFYSFKSLEIDFTIKGLLVLSPLIQPTGPFCLSGGPFHCEFLQNPFVSNIAKSERWATVFCECAELYFCRSATNRDWLLELYTRHVAIKGDHTNYHFWL